MFYFRISLGSEYVFELSPGLEKQINNRGLILRSKNVPMEEQYADVPTSDIKMNYKGFVGTVQEQYALGVGRGQGRKPDGACLSHMAEWICIDLNVEDFFHIDIYPSSVLAVSEAAFSYTGYIGYPLVRLNAFIFFSRSPLFQ